MSDTTYDQTTFGLENEDDIRRAVEALLFVSTDPVSATSLSRILSIRPSKVDAALVSLKTEYEERNRGFLLYEGPTGWKMVSNPEFSDLIQDYVLSWDTRKLSQAALETLSVIVYHQPATRETIRSIRGVNSDSAISSLVDKGLVKEVGKEKGLGAATLFGTTEVFLDRFGLRSLEDLPSLENFAPDEESKKLIRERLSSRTVQTSLEGTEIDDDE